jgi:hypothetical protein
LLFSFDGQIEDLKSWQFQNKMMLEKLRRKDNENLHGAAAITRGSSGRAAASAHRLTRRGDDLFPGPGNLAGDGF